jgi:hypothetical protein
MSPGLAMMGDGNGSQRRGTVVSRLLFLSRHDIPVSLHIGVCVSARSPGVYCFPFMANVSLLCC